MVEDNSTPNRAARIAMVFAIGLAFACGLWLFTRATRAAEPSTVVATSCEGFAADATKLFDKSDNATLRGTFAPGDHVHLVIDFKGNSYSWEITGALGVKPEVTHTGPFTNTFTSTTTRKTKHPVLTELTTSSERTSPTAVFTKSIKSHGRVGGFARLKLEFDVETSGEGAITINNTGSVPLSLSPRVTIASCSTAEKARPSQHGEARAS